MRLALLASVGLIVLAPSPVAWLPPGMTDIRLFDDPEPGALPLARLGDLPAKDSDLLWSGVIDCTVRFAWVCRAGGWRDLAFAAREVVRPRAELSLKFPPEPVLIRADISGICARPWVAEDVLDVKLGRRLGSALEPKSVSMMPGPIDLRGAFAFAKPTPEMGG